MRLRKYIFFAIAMLALAGNSASAQFLSALMGVDGLTCSACSYGTERSLLKLDFVDSVKMDLNKNTADITFRKEKEVQIDALSKKVYDAGFSVRFIEAIYRFEKPAAVVNNIVMTKSAAYYILTQGTTSLSGNVRMRFINEKYVSKKELSPWRATIAGAKSTWKSSSVPLYFVEIR